MDKAIVAFTGGVQSSVCLHWLWDHEGYNVKAVVADLGQKALASALGEYAVRIGARGAHIEDCREEFCRDYAFKALKASGTYERRYLLSGALARPLIATVLTRLAREEGCRYVALGACSRSNDLARFEAYVAALAPELKIIGPAQVPPLKTRQSALQYLQQHGVAPQEGVEARLSFDANLWGASVAADPTLGTWDPVPEAVYQLTTSPVSAPEQPEQVVVEFDMGIPVAVDGKRMAPHELVKEMNDRAGRHGVGRGELIEDRLVGIKAREVYEAPGATALIEAHAALEELTLDYETLQVKQNVARQYAELVYAGGWFTQLKEALDGFVDVTQQRVGGEVRLELFRGRAGIVGRRSPWSLYDSGPLLKDQSGGTERGSENPGR
jgi:argininosuccinate synthase